MYWLIQRGQFTDLNSKNLFYSRFNETRDSLIDLEYMGAAEFEFGALPRSGRRISEHKIGNKPNDYSLHKASFSANNDVPVWIFCMNDKFNQFDREIHLLIEGEYTGKIRFKEAPRIYPHFYDPNYDDQFTIEYWAYIRKTNFWWVIDGEDDGYDVMFFVGAQDRVNAFNRTIDKYLEYFRTHKEEKK